MGTLNLLVSELERQYSWGPLRPEGQVKQEKKYEVTGEKEDPERSSRAGNVAQWQSACLYAHGPGFGPSTTPNEMEPGYKAQEPRYQAHTSRFLITHTAESLDKIQKHFPSILLFSSSVKNYDNPNIWDLGVSVLSEFQYQTTSGVQRILLMTLSDGILVSGCLSHTLHRVFPHRALLRSAFMSHIAP